MTAPDLSTLTEQRRERAAARRYLTACVELRGATGPNLETVLIEHSQAFHDMLLAFGYPCECDPGTCPGLETTHD